MTVDADAVSTGSYSAGAGGGGGGVTAAEAHLQWLSLLASSANFVASWSEFDEEVTSCSRKASIMDIASSCSHTQHADRGMENSKGDCFNMFEDSAIATKIYSRQSTYRRPCHLSFFPAAGTAHITMLDQQVRGAYYTLRMPVAAAVTFGGRSVFTSTAPLLTCHTAVSFCISVPLEHEI